MYTFVMALHILVCLAIVFIILLQKSRGAEMGAAFGGSSQTIFGTSGALTFLNKITTIVAVLFMVTSLALANLSTPKKATSVVVDQPGVEQTVPSDQAQPQTTPDVQAGQEQPTAAVPSEEQAPPPEPIADEGQSPQAVPLEPQEGNPPSAPE